VIDQPEPPQLAMMLIPALTSASMLLYGIISKQFFLLVLGVLVTVASMATPRLMHAGARKAALRRNDMRQLRYGEVLDNFAAQIKSAADATRAALESAHPTPDLLAQWIRDGHLWGRRASDPDFLDVALGAGDIPSGLTVTVAKSAVLEADVFADLRDRAEALQNSAAILRDAPLVISLKEQAVLSIEGTREHAVALARATLLEAVVCCGPDELTLFVASPPEKAREWEWATLIPHALHRNDASRSIPVIATDWKDLSVALARTVGARIQLLSADDQALAKARLQHVVIVLDDYHPLSELSETPLLKETLDRAAELGVTVLTINHEVGNSPAESSCVLTVGSNKIATMRLSRIPSATVRFGPLNAPPAAASVVSRQISGLKLVTDISYGTDSSQDLLLDLLNRRTLDTDAPSWRRLAARDFLTATFGVQADGRPFRLDLKEGAVHGDGPHGLLIGATGSGKSELLRSMITALALTHDPAWLQMAFVDFKGGAAFDSLAELPHCAGYITNILEDLSLIERMRSSLQGELLARQRQFAATGLDLQNIRDYWALREDQPELPPMPYLLLVIDEFGELLEVNPEFLDVLLAVGRQGRSLGVHLILSSQRLEAGRIRGLESYLSYRIALRTFTADESAAAIGSKLAASLPPLAGHGYFRAAETFQRFKASQVSVDGGDLPARGLPATSRSLTVADHSGSSDTDLARVVKWMSPVPRVAPLWLRPLPNTAHGEILALDDERLGAPGDQRPVREGVPVKVGLLDDPQNRGQVPAIFDAGLRGGHVALVGAPQSGKSSAMASEVLQAARTYPPALLRFFLLDFGGGLLTAVRDLPNVGACATPQEPDRVARIITEMLTLLDERATEFRRSGVSGMADLRSRVGRDIRGSAQAHTVLIIDNYAAFKERYLDFDSAVERILVEGANFGLHVQLTSSRWGDMSARKLDQIANRIELRLNDPIDSTYGKARATAIRTSGPGRALGPGGMQLQFTMPALGQYGPLAGSDSPGADGLADVAAVVTAQARASWGDLRASALLLLDDLTADEFEHVAAIVPPGQALLGVNESGFRPFLFEPGRDGNLLMLGDLGTSRSTTLSRIASGLTGAGSPVVASAVVQSAGSVDVFIVDFRGNLTALLGPEGKAAKMASSPDETKEMVAGLKAKLEARMASDAGQTHRPILLVVDDFELVQAMTPMGQSLLGEISAYLLLAERLGFSAVVNQLAAGSQSRGTDVFLRRMTESAPWRMHFSVASRAETLLGGHRGRKLPAARAEVIRTGYPTALVSTLSPQ
jgi:S-DNA-T family DNA segregation ATPase FtsK/SpoIIIE